MNGAVRVALAAAFLACAPPPAVAAGRPVVFSTSDGTVLSGTIYETRMRPAPAVVLVHMLGRSHEDWAMLAARFQDVGITALAFDLRGHGRSGGDGSALTSMLDDVKSALQWLAGRQGVHPGAVGVVGASLGANLAALAAAELPWVRAVGLVSPSLDYRGVRLNAAVMRKLDDRAVWLAASTEDPYALRTLRALEVDGPAHEQRLSGVRAHGSVLLNGDLELSRALVDWLRRTLIF